MRKTVRPPPPFATALSHRRPVPAIAAAEAQGRSVAGIRPAAANSQGHAAMTKVELVDLMNRTATALVETAVRCPLHVNDMRCLAVRLQILAMELEDRRPGPVQPRPLDRPQSMN
jgi:hypothetical protein